MADRTLGLGIDVDDASLNRAKKRLQDIESAQAKLSREFLEGARGTDEYAREVAKLTKEQKQLEKVVDAVTGEFTAQAKAQKEAAEEARRLAKEREKLANTSDIQRRTDRFDDTSRDVSLAGDVESNVRTIGGALGAFGGTSAEGAIGKGAELFAVIEAIPRLKEAAAGLPATINAAGAALGTSGAGLVGALGIAAIAIGAMGLALKKFTDDAKKQAEQLAGVIQTRRDIATDIGTGRAASDVEQQIATDKKVLVEQQKLLADLEASYNSLNVALRQTEQGKKLKEELDTQRTLVQDLQEDITQYSQALADGKFAADKVADATTTQVEAEKQLAAAREQTSSATNRASASEARSSRFAQRRADSAGSRSAATIGGLFTARGADASQSDKSELDNARQKAQEIEQQYQDSLLEAQIDFNREREKEARRAEFELAKIGKEAKRAEQDATRERNFAAAADAREDAAENLQDLKDQQAFEAREREIAYRNQQDDLRRAQQNQLRELQNSMQQRNQMEMNFAQNSLNIWEQYFNRLLDMQRRATTDSTGGTRATGGNQQLSMNSLLYIQG